MSTTTPTVSPAIANLIRAAGYGDHHVERHEGNLTHRGDYYDIQHCPSQRGGDNVFHNGRSERTETERTAPSGYFRGGGEYTTTVSGATWAFTRNYGRRRNGGTYHTLGMIWVWDACSIEQAEEMLAEIRRLCD